MIDLHQLVINSFSNDKTLKRFEEDIDIGLWKSEEKLIKKYFKNGSYILDLGCGTGGTTFKLNDLGYKVIGIDITPKMIKIAQKYVKKNSNDISFNIGDATDLEFEDEYFDNVLFSFNGFTQIPYKENRIKAIKEIERVLKSGGYFIFTTNIRKYNLKFLKLWIKEFIKFYFLKPLGLIKSNFEFGDIIFTNTDEKHYNHNTYINIPSRKEILDLFNHNSSFNLVLNDYRSLISPEDKKIRNEDCMFYVFKKK